MWRSRSSARRSTRTSSCGSTSRSRRWDTTASARSSSRSTASATSRSTSGARTSRLRELPAGTRVELLCRGERFYAVSARTFADAPRGSLILYEDSYGSFALAVSQGSAAQLLRVEEGAELVLDLAVR